MKFNNTEDHAEYLSKKRWEDPEVIKNSDGLRNKINTYGLKYKLDRYHTSDNSIYYNFYLTYHVLSIKALYLKNRNIKIDIYRTSFASFDLIGDLTFHKTTNPVVVLQNIFDIAFDYLKNEQDLVQEGLEWGNKLLIINQEGED